MKNIKTMVAIPALTAAMLAGGALAGYAGLAAAQTATGTADSTQQRHMFGPHIGGTITAINGSTLSIAGKDGTTYTVDVSGATVKKFAAGTAPATASLSDLKVGDEVGIKGTVSGTSVTAKEIMDGVPPKGFRGGKGEHERGPGTAGTVSAVSGSSITITGFDGKTYTVNAAGATVQKMMTVSVSDIKVGDKIGIKGTLSGSDITATAIMDGMPEHPDRQ